MAKSRFRYDATLTQPGEEYLRFRGGKDNVHRRVELAVVHAPARRTSGGIGINTAVSVESIAFRSVSRQTGFALM